MAEDEILVNVNCRGVTLLEQAAVIGVEGQEGFLATDAPMPVGTPMMVQSVDNPQVELSAQVISVVEVLKSSKGPGAAEPGMMLSFVIEGDSLEQAFNPEEGESEEVVIMAEASEEGDEGQRMQTVDFVMPPEMTEPEPAADEPSDEEPAAEEPMYGEPNLEEPAAEEPVNGEPSDEEPAAEEPMYGEPNLEEPAVEEPVAEEPKKKKKKKKKKKRK